MEIQNRVIDSSERKNWDQIYKYLVNTLLKKEEELQYLASTWKILEYKSKTQHENYIYDVRSYENQLSLMRNEIKALEMMRVLEISKLNLLHRFMETELLEQNKEVLDSFKPWFDLLSLSENKDDNSNSGDGDECNALVGTIKKQKLEFEKLAFGKRCDASSLLQEAGFAWSQFKHMESRFTKELIKKDKEIKEANRMISSLQEQLQSSNSENSRLEAKVAELKGNASKNKVKPLRRSPRLNKMLT